MDHDRKPKNRLAIVLLAGGLAAACALFFLWPVLNEPGGPIPGDPPVRLTTPVGDPLGSATVARVARSPRAYSRCPLYVEGRVFPAGDGFFLVDDGASLFVDTPSGEALDAIRPGELRAVRVAVGELSSQQAATVTAHVRDLRGTAPDPVADALETTPATAGEPVLAYSPVAPGEAGVSEREALTRASYELADVQNRFERACLNVTVTGLGSVLDEEIDEPTLAASRYEIVPGGREFELLVFPSPRAARSALGALRDTEMVEDGGALVVGANVVAAFPEPPRTFRGYQVVRDVVRSLAVDRSD